LDIGRGRCAEKFGAGTAGPVTDLVVVNVPRAYVDEILSRRGVIADVVNLKGAERRIAVGVRELLRRVDAKP
jgi:hypothetical protein